MSAALTKAASRLSTAIGVLQDLAQRIEDAGEDGMLFREGSPVADTLNSARTLLCDASEHLSNVEVNVDTQAVQP